MTCGRIVGADVLNAAVLVACGLLAAHSLFGQIDPQIYYGLGEAGEDVWFDADTFTAYNNLTNRQSNHYRTDLHPLQSILTYPIVAFFHWIGLSHYDSVRLFVSVIAGLWLGVFYVVLRSVGLKPLDGLLFSVLLASSATAIFMAPIAELFLLGSITLLLPFLVLSYRPLSTPLHIAVSAATLSLTVTNWMSGIFSTLFSHQFKRALMITACALGAVVLLWILQKAWFPSAHFFVPDPTGRLYEPSLSLYRNRMWLPTVALVDIANRATVFFSHVMVMPGIKLTMHREHEALEWPSISVMDSPLGSGGPFVGIATILWFILLAIGLWALAKSLWQRERRLLCGLLSLTLLGQFVLHLKFGVESFLYSLHWTPLLVLMTALAALTELRKVAITLAGLLILIGGLNNYLQFRAITPLVVPNKAVWISKVGEQISYDLGAVLREF